MLFLGKCFEFAIKFTIYPSRNEFSAECWFIQMQRFADSVVFLHFNIPRGKSHSLVSLAHLVSVCCFPLHCVITCLLSSLIISSAFVLTCDTAAHLGPIWVPPIHHLLASLHNFHSVTPNLLIDFHIWFSRDVFFFLSMARCLFCFGVPRCIFNMYNSSILHRITSFRFPLHDLDIFNMKHSCHPPCGTPPAELTAARFVSDFW